MAGQGASGGAVRARRNVRWMAVGVMAICLGGLGAALLYGNLSNAHSVITVTRTVFRDQVITADDLGVTSAADVAGVETVPVERLDEVVGRTALQDLTGGSLLSPRAYGEPAVEAGSVRVGLRLAAGRIPSSPMPPGTEVLLVPVARDGGEVPVGASVAGRIATEASTLPDGASVVDVTVAASEAERVARLAAGDQLVLVRLAGGPR
ncbi:MAG: flagellar biosynthesis protein FlgA [Propionicimonas sp.]|uniref:SAF domain-containing protein n=1 Tax=Propionicimonas sp. TaxID=1955623 RepID=UPI003D14AEE0